ncbi:MAG: hypothetical protein ACUVTP_00850 [Candidatus Fervidibacter sp.]|uniref:hypothetical protein n=1 Tax=Candidatus Fervidibacter sp. TaxID=3100871 RepID=UPI00404A222B
MPLFAPRHILVKLKPGANKQTFIKIAQRRGLRLKGRVYGTDWIRVSIPKGSTPRQMAIWARKLPEVLHAVPDILVRINDTIPCDPLFQG